MLPARAPVYDLTRTSTEVVTEAPSRTVTTTTSAKPVKATTAPGQWTATAPKPVTASKIPRRTSVFSRLSSWARSDETEIDRHPVNCDCGDHPKAKRDGTVIPTPTPTAVQIKPYGTVVPSVWAETYNLSKVGESVKRVSTYGLDKPSER